MNDQTSVDNVSLEDLRGWKIALTSQVESLRLEIQGRSTLLGAIEEKLSLVRRLLELNERLSRGEVEGTIHDSEERRPPNGAELVEDAAEQILSDGGEPMHISAIRGALLQRGCPIPGRADDANVIVRLSKYPERFIRTARGTYALAAWGIPAMKSKRKRPLTRKAG
jgi:hypothetical protein